ncbi:MULTISPECIES: PRK06770 family protein [Bacillus cereus group]|uniref:PRK06770 family protein n=1 Tax=Bacillus cereus group TaxID=86661 RepID=UPI001F5997A4|nr:MULTISPECIES: PRK06770 family protein [Bacillus cereus group]MED0827209.1 PRK06770 family protein [Bacillus pacificus]
MKITSSFVIAIAVGSFTGYKVGTYAGSDVKEKQTDKIKGEEVILDLNSDRHIISAMHKMTHQKVLSHEKQGFIKMTPENIETVRQVIDESNSGTLQHKEQYLKILVRWYEGDFSQSVEEHNLLWELENNSTGQAYELATSKQEEAYILEQGNSEKQ